MLTSFRLDPDLRQRINIVYLFFKKGKNFSDTLRFLIELGLQRFEETQLASLINVGTDRDIQFIAQKNDLGIPLSMTEIAYLLEMSYSSIQDNAFLNQERVSQITDLFAFIVKNCCSFPQPYTLEIFKKNGFIEHKDSFSINHINFIKQIEEKTLSLIKNAKSQKTCLEDRSVIQNVKDMLYILASLADPKENHLPESNIFREIITPYLPFFIRVAKWKLGINSARSVTHLISFDRFLSKNHIEREYFFQSDRYEICLTINRNLETKAYIKLKEKGVELQINFYELDELMNLVKLISSSLPSQQNTIIEGTTLKMQLPADSKKGSKAIIHVRSSGYKFSSEEWDEFTNLLNKIEQNLSLQLAALQNQLGSYQ